jgi:LmbE family N-acetylglucosaminyl deacetylase
MATHPRVQIVSPHQDDASFSLGMVLFSLARLGAAIHIVNCFTASEYAPFLHSHTPVPAQRAEEDRRFVSRLGGPVTVTDLGHLDAPLRRGIACDQVCAQDGEEPGELAELVSDLTSLNPGDVVFVPMAIGNHVDHRLARRAALRTFSDAAIGFYEDLPYAARDPEVKVEAALPAYVHRLQGGLGIKRDLIDCYDSQIDGAGADLIISYAEGYGAGERLWLTDTARDLLLEGGLELR